MGTCYECMLPVLQTTAQMLCAPAPVAAFSHLKSLGKDLLLAAGATLELKDMVSCWAQLPFRSGLL